MTPNQPNDTSAGDATRSAALASLAARYWRERLEESPIEATLLGERRFDDRMPDITPAGHARQKAKLVALRDQVTALPDSRLAATDAVTRSALLGEIEADLAQLDCQLDEWTVDPLNGPQVFLLSLATLQSVESPEQGRALAARWAKLGAYLDAHIENLRRGLSQGKVAPAGAVRRVLGQLTELLAQPDREWILRKPAAAPRPGWSQADRDALAREVDRAIAEGARPAFARYKELLEREILPRARDEAQAGISHVPGGAACYTRLIKVHTSLDLSAEEIHRFGMEEVARIRAEMSELGRRALGTGDLPAIQKRLRTDPSLYFSTRDEVEQKATSALRRAEAAVPKWFLAAPRAACVVKRVEAHEEKDTTIAYYRPPAIDGTRPGAYHVNTYAPETRPRFEAEVLAFHEAVPGHHTQIALAQDLQLPEFRKHLGVTAFAEGWALYTERLANEMNLYSGDLDRLGMLSFDAWRACRLVVDTGLHARGWSRRQAIAFMMDNTVLAANNIENEVDRYITWPAQALAYKIGQREILALRAQAEQRLGRRFDIRAFHDVVLRNGAVSLSILRGEVERWIEAAATD